MTRKWIVLGVLVLLLLIGAGAVGRFYMLKGKGRPLVERPVRPAMQDAPGTSPAVRPAAVTAGWPQFRGPGGNGVSNDEKAPLEWGDDKNVKWKTALPGAGASSPIVSGNLVFVTCYSGYGLDTKDPGNIADLKRHVVCCNLETGEIVWSKVVDAIMPEDEYSGIGITEHGYASNTPVTDGERLYVFFGKSGVLAYDFSGKELWRADMGHESSNRGWGTSASPILYGDTLIVNAAEESQSVRGLDKMTGKELWKAEGSAMELTYSTPLIVPLPDGRDDLVVAVPSEIWGLNPSTGKLVWYATSVVEGNASPSPVLHDGVVYVMGGYPKQQTVAIRPGGTGDVTTSNVLWTSDAASYVASPVQHEGRLYWVEHKGYANCINTADGAPVYREKLPRAEGARGGKADFYASALLIKDKVYAVSRTSGTYVLAAKPEFELLAQNVFASDTSDFNASPAVVDGKILLRSNQFLYCIAGE